MGMTKHREMQLIIKQYKDETGKRQVDLHEVAKWAVARGWPLPTPANPIDRLAREFREAAREEIKHDAVTGKPYRVNHAVTMFQSGQQLTFWVDIDEAPQDHMLKSLVNRR